MEVAVRMHATRYCCFHDVPVKCVRTVCACRFKPRDPDARGNAPPQPYQYYIDFGVENVIRDRMFTDPQWVKLRAQHRPKSYEDYQAGKDCPPGSFWQGACS